VDTSWKQRVKEYLAEVNRSFVDGDFANLGRFYGDKLRMNTDLACWKREYEQYQARGARVLTAKTVAQPLRTMAIDRDGVEVVLSLHQLLEYKLRDVNYLQENRRVQKFMVRKTDCDWLLWPQENLSEDEAGIENKILLATGEELEKHFPANQEVNRRYQYNRQKAVAYADTYWDTYNPAFPHFKDDCTNFISQCLYAGGIQMTGYGNRNKGWWIKTGAHPVWSYSWTVAHSLYLLLKSGRAPFYAKAVQAPSELEIGDVICYDFNGDGRWQHNTIVVAKDWYGMPLVNAHTTNSRYRYWEYRDSTAYTPNIQYAFFHIDGNLRAGV